MSATQQIHGPQTHPAAQRRVIRGIAGGLALALFLASSAAWAQDARADRTARAFLGVLVGPAQGGENGVLIREVTADSPAAKSGLKSGDRVVKVDDQDVQDVENFLQTIGSKKPGDRLTLRLVRDGQEQTVTATLGEMTERPELPSPRQSERPGLPGGRRPAFLGVQTQRLTPELKSRTRVTADAGAVVTEVVSNAPAAKAGLRPDDVITAVNDRAIHDPEQLREAIQQAGPGKEVTLQVARGNENLSLKATLGEAPFGLFPTPGIERYPAPDVEMMVDPGRRMRDLERRLEALEKRVQELEKKQAPPR
jgi:S1-C subfamily serine protease